MELELRGHGKKRDCKVSKVSGSSIINDGVDLNLSEPIIHQEKEKDHIL